MITKQRVERRLAELQHLKRMNINELLHAYELVATDLGVTLAATAIDALPGKLAQAAQLRNGRNGDAPTEQSTAIVAQVLRDATEPLKTDEILARCAAVPGWTGKKYTIGKLLRGNTKTHPLPFKVKRIGNTSNARFVMKEAK
jgi:hypothetical protein